MLSAVCMPRNGERNILQLYFAETVNGKNLGFTIKALSPVKFNKRLSTINL